MLENWQIEDIQVKAPIWRKTAKKETDNIPFSTTSSKIVRCGCAEGVYTYVRYTPSALSYYPYRNGTIACSDLFNGCIFSIFQHKNIWYIAHLANESDGVCWTELWLPFCKKNNITVFTLFYPAGGNGEIVELGLQLKKPNVQAVGVIVVNETNYMPHRPLHDCYSLVYEDSQMNQEHLKKIHWRTFTEELLQRTETSSIPKTTQQSLEAIESRRLINLRNLNNKRIFQIDTYCLIT